MERISEEQLQNLNEDLNTELKEAKANLPSSIWETFSSFANTAGGTIYLGIQESKKKPNIIVPIKNPSAMVKQIWDCLNNQNLVSKNILNINSIEVIPVSGGSVIAINVPEAKYGDKPVFIKNSLNNTFKRNYEGDYRCTLEEIKQMIRDSGSEFEFDSRPNNFGYSFVDVIPKVLEEYRNDMKKYKPSSFYNKMGDEEFLRATDCLVEFEGRLVLTNAAVLFFSTYEKIMKIYPNYWLDYKEISSSSDRWDFRITSDDIENGGNLYFLFNAVIKRLYGNLPNKFQLRDSTYNVSGEDLKMAIREAFVNCLVNNDYFSAGGMKITKYLQRIEFENGGLIPVGLEQAIKGGKSLPRNKQLMMLFRRLGVCERAGSGIPFIFRTCRNEQIIPPNFIEDKAQNKTRLTFNLPLVENSTEAESDAYSKVIGALERYPDGVTAIKISKDLNIGYNQARNLLISLVGKGIVKTNNKATRGKLYFLSK